MPNVAPEEPGLDRWSVLLYLYAAFMVGLVLGEMLAKQRARRRVTELLGEL